MTSEPAPKHALRWSANYHVFGSSQRHRFVINVMTSAVANSPQVGGVQASPDPLQRRCPFWALASPMAARAEFQHLQHDWKSMAGRRAIVFHSGDACCGCRQYSIVHHPQPKSRASLTLTGSPGMAASPAGNGPPGPDPWTRSPRISRWMRWGSIWSPAQFGA